VVGAVLLGGTEKLREGDDYGVPLHDGLEEGLAATGAEVVVDLSDEPVAGPELRFLLASRALAAGARYVGADFQLDPVPLASFELPSLAVIGTGKRVGKTAVAGRLARLLARDRSVVVVAMGRGGPPEPVLASPTPSLAELLALARGGDHAASDYLEDAALAGVPTIGCRRCGGGLAGAPFTSNVLEGARLAVEAHPDIVVFEGSGAAIPPMAVDRRVLVTGAFQGPNALGAYLGPYRVLLSDLVVLTGCESPFASAHEVALLREAAGVMKPGLPVVATIFRPRPVSSVAGRRVAFFTTAPPPAQPLLRTHLEEVHGAEVVFLSGSLADRPSLRRELASAEVADAEVVLVELKAAAIDVVARAADERGVEVVLCDNELLPAAEEEDVDAQLLALAAGATEHGSVAA